MINLFPCTLSRFRTSGNGPDQKTTPNDEERKSFDHLSWSRMKLKIGGLFREVQLKGIRPVVHSSSQLRKCDLATRHKHLY